MKIPAAKIELATSPEHSRYILQDWDNTYDGEPLKDYEIKFLKILGKA